MNNKKEEKHIINSAINSIRFLSLDAIQKADSGHPGLPLGAAAMAYTLFMKHLRYNPKNPQWPDRDRFILSGGHGSMLIYSLLYLTGYDLSIEDIKSFRKFGSKTPGHPELGATPGVETTTGPLGQGFATGVGMAIAETHLASIFNKNNFNIIDHYIYAIVTDGDLMEGVTAEAASLAGHLGLGNLIYLYDDNKITIDGSTDITFTENVRDRFLSYNWHVLSINNGNDVDEIDKAITIAKSENKPSLIICPTHIGYGLPNRQDTPQAHGEPAGNEEVREAKKNLGWPLEPDFFVPQNVLDHFRSMVEIGEKLEENWNNKFNLYRSSFPELANELVRRINGDLPTNWEENIATFQSDSEGLSTREASGKILNEISKSLPELIGGSADLTPSTKTWMNNSIAFQKDTPSGKNLFFGVREHAMAAITNGLAIHKGLRPFAATYLVFSDYMRPALRISALSRIPGIWIFSHDSIALGEDGPTHQPIEQLATLRAIPGLTVIRPGDANEVSQAWKFAVENNSGPTALILCRQSIPTLTNPSSVYKNSLRHGAYIFKDFGSNQPDIILMASGSELSLIVEAGKILKQDGINVRIVSFPSWRLFEKQSTEYQNIILPVNVKIRLAVEPGIVQGWEKYLGPSGHFIGMKSFGISSPSDDILKKFGFTVENVIQQAKRIL